jgi:CRISPR/Cas system-associated protein Cas7 (RAMP superfamily)
LFLQWRQFSYTPRASSSVSLDNVGLVIKMEEMTALPNPESVRERIDSALETLGNLSSATVSRAEVMEQLQK